MEDRKTTSQQNQVCIGGVTVNGRGIDAQTRCVHYHGPLDIVGIRFKCCGDWFSCYFCHEELTDHESVMWQFSEGKKKAIICGSCGTRLSIDTYLDGKDQCPHCKAHFNPGCRLHHHLYFELRP
ncbi:MAG: CHY zinc finger protein [Gammaproteobacteria bacterium]|nr:CHY zinc finger protein [Gammaproteobacteria bacterium]